MGDERCFLLCLISNKRQVFGVHVMIEAPVNTCSQKINVKFFPTPSSSIKRKKNLNADHEKREAEVISPYLYISVSKGCVIMLKKITRMDGHGPQQYRNQDGAILSCFLHQILTLPSKYHGRIRDSPDQATFLQSCIV